MNNIGQILKENIINILKEEYSYELSVDDSNFTIDIPKDNTLGDYSTTICLKLAKQLHNSPVNIANKLKEILLTKDLPIREINVAGPGFLNFFIEEYSIANSINTIIEQDGKYGYNDSGKGSKILVEYVSANPTGDLHVGHAKAAAWGDSITRLLKMSGYDCLREYYINDGGAQIDNLANSLIARYLQVCGIEAELPQDGYHGQDIIQIAKEVYQEVGEKYINFDENERFTFFKKLGLEKELAKIRKILKDFGVEFDVWSSEAEIRGENNKNIKELINKLSKEKVEINGKKQPLIFKRGNAIWLRTQYFGDDKNRVLQKSNGLYTYFTPDILYHVNKLERGYTHLVDLLGADHHGYIARMRAALMMNGYSADCFDVDIIQMIRLMENGVEVKMSKRTGKAITLKELMEEIGVDATRYFLCSRAADTHLDFDLGLAKTQSQDNPVYYAQYAHARMCSILRNAPEFSRKDSYTLLKDQKEIDLLKHINEFPTDVALAAKNRAPNKICLYIQKLAQLFHSFYNSCKVIDETNKELTQERVALIIVAKITMRNALNIIGVSAPEKM